MKIAIYGGSFNPPHLGHIRVANAAVKDLNPDILLVIPDNIPPHKDLSENAPSAQQRYEMCEIAFRDIPSVTISKIELDRGGRSYTIDTIKEVKSIYPDSELFLIMGMDMIESFHSWYMPEEIEKLCSLYVAPRGISSESSSQARIDISNCGISNMLSNSINNYISERNLYCS